MNFKDIAFILFATIMVAILVWEIIPDQFKKYWGYIRQLRKDTRAGRKGKYSFTWRINKGA